MMNIWNYIYKSIRLTDIDGVVFVGEVIDVSAKEDIGEAEDSLTLELANGQILGFAPSEIKEIKIL
ncbi:MAG: hypothetical protein SPE18_12075 [Candidatus Limivicinus sp.]|nr:hypothetical protein [Candidatus Limivicinus sp.]